MTGMKFMMHRFGVVAAAAVLMMAVPSSARAEADYGQACMAMDNFVDTFRVTITIPSGSEPIVAMNFRWRAEGSYQIVGSGALTPDPETGDLQMDLVGAHDTSSFGGNPICSAHALLDPSSLSGPLRIVCVGGTGARYTQTDTVSITGCDSSFATKSGPALGSN
jgi:hypothetical protein